MFEPFGCVNLTVMMNPACIQGLFKAKLRAFAATLLNGPQKLKEIEERDNLLGVTHGSNGMRHYCNDVSFVID
jgi:hypothetical protein